MPLLPDRTRARTQLAKQSGIRLTADERAVQQAIREGIQQARDRIRAKRLRDAIERNNFTDAETSVDLTALAAVFAPLALLLGRLANREATETATSLRVAGRFDIIDQNSVNWARAQSARMVQNLTNQQLLAVRSSILASVSGQLTVDETARIIRSSIGLTDRYQRAVQTRYVAVRQAALNAGRSSLQAANSATAAAVKTADRLVRARARTIARTEVAAAINAGRMISWTQALDAGILPPDSIKRWDLADDACDICVRIAEEFNNRIDIPVLGEFYSVNEFGAADGVWHGTMPPVHPNCRCAVYLETSLSRNLRQAA